ncbi:MAG: ArsR family transcriptional regulator [Nitrospirae bacterium]|nr:MAG: ArsR family transcriptional regulator [Nitrospirota bacterium]
MDAKEQARYAARAKVIKALAHPTRLFLVDRLARGEACVCQLTELVGADVSTVSKHLSVLKHAGIVADERRGSQVFYTLKQPCVLSFLGCIEAVVAEAAKDQLACVR